jgi:CheY-like chemotaxis protein
MRVSKVLVVDDEPHIVRLVSFSLSRRGYDVLEATDGPSGIELARSEKPDLILMDVMMPGMTGFDAVEKLKAEPATAGIPVVMLSAKSQQYEQQEGLRRGAQKYICKPFTPSALVEAVSEIIGSSD